MATPSKHAVRKARLALAFQNCKREREYCRPIFITPKKVIIRYGGYDVVFVYETGRVCRTGSNDHYPYLEPEDYANLSLLAGDLMQAAFNGVRKDKKVSKSTTEPVQLEFPLAGLPPAGTH